jgi:hypothetical protein
MGTLLDDIAFNAIEIMAACVRARSAPHSLCISVRPTLAMSRRATASEAPLLEGRLDRMVRRHVLG